MTRAEDDKVDNLKLSSDLSWVLTYIACCLFLRWGRYFIGEGIRVPQRSCESQRRTREFSPPTMCVIGDCTQGTGFGRKCSTLWAISPALIYFLNVFWFKKLQFLLFFSMSPWCLLLLPMNTFKQVSDMIVHASSILLITGNDGLEEWLATTQV